MEIINVVPELTKEEREEAEQKVLQIFARIQERLKKEKIIKEVKK